MSKKLTHKEVKKYIESFECKLKSKIYKNARTKLEIECKNKHIFWMRLDNFKQGKRCAKCVGNKKFTYKEIKEYIKLFKYRLKSKKYEGIFSKLKIECDKNHIFFMNFNDFKNGNKRCPECKKLNMSGKNHWNWKGGVTKKNIPLYNTYAHQISWCEKVRRDFKNYLQVKCTNSNCKKWFNPATRQVINRIQALKDNTTGEQRFYCSQICKDTCSIFNQQNYPKGFRNTSNDRSNQREWANLVKKRDNDECQICGKKGEIAHHFEGLNINPIMSADIDMGITLCNKCDKRAHSGIGCRYVDLKKLKLRMCKDDI